MYGRALRCEYPQLILRNRELRTKWPPPVGRLLPSVRTEGVYIIPRKIFYDLDDLSIRVLRGTYRDHHITHLEFLRLVPEMLFRPVRLSRRTRPYHVALG